MPLFPLPVKLLAERAAAGAAVVAPKKDRMLGVSFREAANPWAETPSMVSVGTCDKHTRHGESKQRWGGKTRKKTAD